MAIVVKVDSETFLKICEEFFAKFNLLFEAVYFLACELFLQPVV